jgi:hypothetical protein
MKSVQSDRPNNALEQTATTSRSWHRRHGVGSTAPARQERSGPPLLTAGVRFLFRNSTSLREVAARLVALIIASVFGFLVATDAKCQTRHGALGVSIAAGLSGDRVGGSGSPSWGGTSAVSAGYFLSGTGEVGVSLAITAPEGLAQDGRLSVYGTAHFPGSPESRVVPFMGAQLGRSLGLSGPTQLGVYGGLELFLSSQAAMSLRPYYQRAKDDLYMREEYGILLGVSVFTR